jgi:adenine-specific DNA-methyltransferase
MDKRAVEQGDITFFELAALSVDVSRHQPEAPAPGKRRKGNPSLALRAGEEKEEELGSRSVTLTLTDFVIPPDDVPEEVRAAVKHWSQWIDYWAVDWDNKTDTFHNQWQAFRTRKDNKLLLEVTHEYPDAGEYRIVVKVIDILGNDTTKTVKVKVK